MQVEISQLELRYAALRLIEANHRAKLLASIAKDGQQSPVTVVAGEEPERFVLIDGYARVAVLRQLARDVVEAVALELSEAEALVMSHRLDGQRRRSALEEGWLLDVLMERHGQSLAELATRAARSLAQLGVPASRARDGAAAVGAEACLSWTAWCPRRGEVLGAVGARQRRAV